VSAKAPIEDEFSPRERAALAAWRAPLPSADFAERVLARASAQPQAAAPSGRLAVAALALILLGGALSVRTLFGRSTGAPAYESPALGGFDAGPRPEVREPFDGVERRPS
jgi:hypothetical protein